jgi:hypothetical protein
LVGVCPPQEGQNIIRDGHLVGLFDGWLGHGGFLVRVLGGVNALEQFRLFAGLFLLLFLLGCLHAPEMGKGAGRIFTKPMQPHDDTLRKAQRLGLLVKGEQLRPDMVQLFGYLHG